MLLGAAGYANCRTIHDLEPGAGPEEERSGLRQALFHKVGLTFSWLGYIYARFVRKSLAQTLPKMAGPFRV